MSQELAALDPMTFGDRHRNPETVIERIVHPDKGIGMGLMRICIGAIRGDIPDEFAISWRGKTVTPKLEPGTVATYIWQP